MPYYMSDIDYGNISHSLQHLSNEELKKMLNADENDALLDEKVKDFPQVRKLESEREMLIASNKSLAEFNISKEPIYRQKRQALLTAHKEACDLKKDLESKKEQLEEINRQTSLDITLALLQTAAAEAEEESEAIATKFLNSETPLDPFLQEFIDKRKLSHLRRIKTEKLMEHLRQQPNYGAPSNVPYPMRPAPPPPVPNSVGHPSNAGNMPPYPMHPNYPVNDFQPNLFPFSRGGYR